MKTLAYYLLGVVTKTTQLRNLLLPKDRKKYKKL